jgi:hypothetical protein
MQSGMNYDAAKSACEADGGRLAVMTTESEVIAVLGSIALVSWTLDNGQFSSK